MRKLLLLAMITFCSITHAEILADINFYESLRMVQKRYPNARFENVNAAWLKPEERFIKISGAGLGKVIRVKFDDLRSIKKNVLLKDFEQFSEASKETIIKINRLPESDVLAVKWVRVTYDAVIPLSRFNLKYGKSICGNNQDMERECVWPKYALSAQVTDDDKSVLFLTSVFTASEQDSGIRSMFEFYQGQDNIFSLSKTIEDQVAGLKTWQAAISAFLAKVITDVDYRKDAGKMADLDRFVTIVANKPENANRSMEWFLQESHKLVLQTHGIK